MTKTQESGLTTLPSISWHDVSYRDYISYIKDERFSELNAENTLAFLSHFTKIPEAELGNKSLAEIQLTHLAWISLLSQPNDFHLFSQTHWDRTLETIVFENHVFYFPETIPNIITDTDQPLYNESFGNWLEAMQFTRYYSQLTDGGELEAMPFILALLFRKKDEVVPVAQVEREKWIKRRTAIFERMSMYYVWQALFFFIMPTVLLLQVTQTYFQSRSRRVTRQRKLRQA